MCTSQVADTTAATPPPSTPMTSTATASGPDVHPFTAVGDITKPDMPDNVFYDFGTLSLARTEPIKHTFTLHNGTDAPIKVARVQAACGCTTIGNNGVPGDYKPVEPGKDLTLDISVDPGH